MDVCAELSLRLIRTGQEALGPLSSFINWVICPEMKNATWTEAGELLATSQKPVLIAPLVEPGAIALWSLAALEQQGRAALEYQVSNQSQYYDEKLSALGLAISDTVETPDGEFRLSIAEFKRWAREYCISLIGIGMIRSPSAGT